MTDLTGLLQSAAGDGVHWTLETPGDLNVNLVHLDAGHVVGEHANDEVDVVIIVLAGRGRLTIDGHGTDLTAHVVANVPRMSRRSVRAANDEGLDYLSIHRRRGPLGIRRARSDVAETGAPREEGGDPACWAHLFENDDTETPR
jgi:mannose-6-phosphate isomerase-like protein (cupin superfamily)